ncbi:MAG: translocation/assembly module TamB domain-containing protein [Hydrogenophaga sp.]
MRTDQPASADEKRPPQPAPASPWRGLHRLALATTWMLGATVALLVASAIAFWLWAATPGSLAQSLGWAQSWLKDQAEPIGQLTTEGVEGSLRGGGKIQQLQWSQNGLKVEAQGVQLDWNDALWTDLISGLGARPQSLNIQRLSVHDVRPPTPTEPMLALELPLPVSFAFGVEEFVLSGNTDFSLSGLRGDYAYGPIGSQGDAPPLTTSKGLTHAHQLRLDSVRIADGQYEGKLSLGAQAPMPLAVALIGNLQTKVPDGAGVALTLHAQANGSLSGERAAIDLHIDGEGIPQSAQAKATTLELTARVMPWAKQPLVSANANAQSLNLAALWPNAPTTDLSGTLQAQPEGDSWHAKLAINNALVGPVDQKGLPLQTLKAQVIQQGDRWTVQQLTAQLGGGELSGQGGFTLRTAGNATAITDWQGELKATGIRPALFWSALAKGALDASAQASADPSPSAPNAIQLRASIQPSARQPQGAALSDLQLKNLRVQGQWVPNRSSSSSSLPAGLLKLTEARIAIAGAEINTQGQFDTAQMSFDGSLKAQLPGLAFDAQGLLAHARGQGKAELNVTDAQRLLTWVRSLQDLPLVGKRIQSAMAEQQALGVSGNGNAQLQWTGGLGALSFPAPTALPTVVQTSPSLPTLQVSVSAPSLTVQPHNGAPTLALSNLVAKANGPLNALAISASGTAAAQAWQATLSTEGQLGQSGSNFTKGQLSLSRLALRWVPGAEGNNAKGASESWQINNAQPLRLGWDSSNASTQGTTLDAGAGKLELTRTGYDPSAPPNAPLTLDWQRLVWQANALETQGRLQGLSLPWIEALAAIGQPKGPSAVAQNGISGDLVLDGAWNLRLPANASLPLELSATLQRRGGDLRWDSSSLAASPNAAAPPGGERIAAGVKDAHISLVVQERKAQALLRWDSERLGQAGAEFNTTLGTTGDGNADAPLVDRWWPANTPLNGTAQVSLPQVGVWSMFTPPGWRMSGTLNAKASVGGTRGQPTWRGNVEANGLALRSVVDGFAFVNGQLRASLVGDRLNVERFSLQGLGGETTGGTLEASGQAEWREVPGSALRQPLIKLQAKAQRLRVSTRVDRRVALSGDVSAELSGPALQLRGQLKVDSAQITLPDELAPSLGKDVIVRSTRTLPSQDSAEAVKPDVQVSLDLGNQFEVQGQGINTRLQGQLTVRATPALPAPRAFGEVRTISGTYKAYGQQLNIETGVLRFAGPYDDPALDILAVRKLPENTEQRVGVRITGDAQAPRVSVYSQPDLTNGDALAWLILGRPASAAGAQAFVLQQAARQLLSRGGAPADGALAKTLGVDEFGFADAGGNADGTATETALTVGKRLSDNLYLSYEQSLSGAMSTVSILYDLSRSLTLRARAGTENAVDLIFTHRYE